MPIITGRLYNAYQSELLASPNKGGDIVPYEQEQEPVDGVMVCDVCHKKSNCLAVLGNMSICLRCEKDMGKVI